MTGIKELKETRNILTKNESKMGSLAALLLAYAASRIALYAMRKTLFPIFEITLIFNNSSDERSIIYRDRSRKSKFGYLCKSVYKSLKSSGWYTFDNKRFYNSDYDGYITVHKTKYENHF